MKTYRVQIVPSVTGGRFCRGGRCFGSTPTELREDELTAEQLAAILTEPMLLVVEVPSEEKKPAKPAGKAEGNK